jgi:hypothetical protein
MASCHEVVSSQWGRVVRTCPIENSTGIRRTSSEVRNSFSSREPRSAFFRAGRCRTIAAPFLPSHVR